MTGKEVKFLKEWTLRYIKNKDVLTKKISSVDEKEDYFIIIKADKQQKYFIEPSIEDTTKILIKIKQYEHNKALVCFHTKENYKQLIEHWKEFVEVGRNFTIFFINPFSKTDRVLSITPYTHNLISDEESLEQGLKTMSETVEFINKDEIEKIISS